MDRMGPENAIPFLKWAGGKRWLVQNHLDLFKTPFKRFVEPFLGSGAVFFRLGPAKAILSDANKELIETYTAIKDNWQKVLSHLRRHQRNHCADYYYYVRSSLPRSRAGRAGKFIYLNRTCWNGLYRVNLDGQFNVPIGTKSNVVLDTDDFDKIAQMLSSAELAACDFEETIDRTGRGDLVFVDPPYTVKHNVNGFVKYNEALFSWGDQLRLRDAIVAAKSRGAKVLVTNAYHKSVIDIYTGVGSICCLERQSVISGLASARGRYHEMVVKCY